jgi:hypothetical protein
MEVMAAMDLMEHLERTLTSVTATDINLKVNQVDLASGKKFKIFPIWYEN